MPDSIAGHTDEHQCKGAAGAWSHSFWLAALKTPQLSPASYMVRSPPGLPNRKVQFWCCRYFRSVACLPNHSILRAGPGDAVLTRAFGKLVGKVNGFHSENESDRKTGQGCGCLRNVFLVCVKAAPFSTGSHYLPLILRKVVMGDHSRSVLSFRFCFCLHRMNLLA